MAEQSPFDPFMRPYLVSRGLRPDQTFADYLNQIRSDTEYRKYRDHAECLTRIFDSFLRSGQAETGFHTLTPEMVSYLEGQGFIVEDRKSEGRWVISLPENQKK